MRNTILIAIVVVLGVVIGGWTVSWYVQAWQIKRSFEQSVANLNTSQATLIYDALETSGFPSDVMLTIVRPHFTGRVDTLLKSLGGNAAMPEWSEDDVLNGNITLGINAFSDRYSMHISGDWRSNSKIGDQPMSLAGHRNGDTVCVLHMEHSGGIFADLWNYGSLARDGKTFLKDLRLLDCTDAGNSVSDQTTHEALITTEPSRIYIESIPQNALRQVRVYIKSDSNIAPQGGKVMEAYMHALMPGAPPMRFSAYGKQTLEADFSYNGPADPETAGNNPPLDVALNKFELVNQAYTSSGTFFLTNAMKENVRSARLAFHFESEFSDQYDALLQDAMHQSIQQMYVNKDPRFAPLLDKHTPDEFYAIVAPVFPHLHSLGKLTQGIDASYQGNAEMNAGDVTLANLEFSAAPYGILGKGNAKLTPGAHLPEGQVTLACSNCLHLVDDAAAYAARVQKALMQINPNRPDSIIIDAKLTEGIKSFLKVLAAQDASGAPNFIYVIANQGADLTINGRQMSDVMAMYKEYVSSVMTSQSAAH